MCAANSPVPLDVSIDVGCVFEGHVVLSEQVSIGAHCVIKDSEIGPGTVIAPFSHLDGARVAGHCRVGPYARLRPGTVLAEYAHVGNFVETKNASIGEGSKANHLTYLGDATIGRQVNIGAGTITCNYDGANKHRTIIEDETFIGSDTALVAPVTVGRGATIGAGSVITQGCPRRRTYRRAWTAGYDQRMEETGEEETVIRDDS